MITDIHSHILFGVDDGAKDIEKAIEMLRVSLKSGVDRVVLTPHYNPSYGYNNIVGEPLVSRYKELCEAADKENLSVEIMLGMEIRADYDTAKLLSSGKLITLNGSKYPLIEFSHTDNAKKCEEILKELVSHGYSPVIAHPERFAFFFSQPWIAYDWLELGCHIQITRGSLFGSFGSSAKSASDYLLENSLVCCIASDCHGLNHRTPYMDDVYRYISDTISPEAARLLMRVNPDRITSNKEL